MFTDHEATKPSSASMLGKNCVITGATSGIGKATALELGKMGARIILIGRNETRGRHVADKINAGQAEGHAEFIRCDLSSQADVRELAIKIGHMMPTVDVLVNNAGAKFDKFKESRDGIEMTFATNHLSHFLLTVLLMDLLVKASAARIIFVAGQSHWSANSDFEQCLHPEHYDRRLAAQQAKLANLMFMYDLVERLRGTSITVNAVHPGGVATRIGRNNSIYSWMRHIVGQLLHRNLISPRKGADTTVWLASSDELQGISCKYFYCRKPIDSSPLSMDKEARKRLWDLSLLLTRLPEVSFPP